VEPQLNSNLVCNKWEKFAGESFNSEWMYIFHNEIKREEVIILCFALFWKGLASQLKQTKLGSSYVMWALCNFRKEKFLYLLHKFYLYPLRCCYFRSAIITNSLYADLEIEKHNKCSISILLMQHLEITVKWVVIALHDLVVSSQLLQILQR